MWNNGEGLQSRTIFQLQDFGIGKHQSQYLVHLQAQGTNYNVTIA